jgi:hypothetical protein
MAKIQLIHGDSGALAGAADLMLTDPPFDLPGHHLAEIVARYTVKHLVLITTMRQFLEFYPYTAFDFAFDFVLDGVAPKKSKTVRQPNYTHQTGVYLKAKATPSVFDRKRRQRADQFSASLGYWPSVIHAPRENLDAHGHAKNLAAVTDILGSFDVRSVIDPFAGSGTVGLAAWDLDIDALLIERAPERFQSMKKTLRFIGAAVDD